MKKVFYRYEFWEDYQNGMYRNSNDSGREDRIKRAAELFRDETKCREEMRTVAFSWKISAEVNFTNPSVNKQAWLGQASCCHYCGAGDLETIEAWHTLTDAERDKANEIADEVFAEWCRKYEKEQPDYQYSLFDLGVAL